MLQKSLDTEFAVTKSSLPGIVLESFAADLIFYQGDGPVIDTGIEQPVIKKTEILSVKTAEIGIKTAETVKPENTIGAKPPDELLIHEIEEDKKTSGMAIDEIMEEEQIMIITKDIIEKHWLSIIERIKTKKEDELATAMETAGIVSYEEPVLYITGENKFYTDKIKKHIEILGSVLKEEFKKDFNINIFEKNEYYAKHKANKDVDSEEAKNNPMVKELGKIFKFSSVEIKKASK
jgi:hypothetical protein